MNKLEIKESSFLWLVVPILITFCFGFFALNSFPSRNGLLNHWLYYEANEDCIFYFLPFYDTLYYLGDSYFEVNLKHQKGLLIFRNGQIDSFPISSGNPHLNKGVSTPTGLFAVQYKSPIQISRQFENTEMINWIGFNGNIGFHGLKKKGYYSYLGKRPSSHGCIRISLEDGERLYKIVKIGTPVILFEGQPFRIIKFSHWKEYNPNKDYLVSKFDRNVSKFFQDRQVKLFEGKFYLFGRDRIFLAPKISSTISAIQVESKGQIPIQRPVLFKIPANRIYAVSSFVAKNEIIADTCPIVINK